jgi:RNA polymerase sigma-70 factor (ECF subfamily)
MADDLAFTRAWMAAQPAVASTVIALVWDRHAADDLVQEVAVAAYEGRDRVAPGRDFTAWAVGIARHKAVDWLRARRPAELPDPDALACVAEAAIDQADDLARQEAALHRCVAALDGRARRIVDLFYGQDRPVVEVAAALGVTVGNAKVMLHRVRAALRTCVERALAGPAP